MAEVQSDLIHFIIDLDDDDCPDVGLHVAAYQGNIEALEIQLQLPSSADIINSRVRPFRSSPLRLAATAGHVDCMIALLSSGADVECLDVKAQTPLFVSLVNQHWECARVLLEAGADPNASSANLCSPLSIMCQRGFYPGVKLLCEFGADTEDILRILSGMPGLPITSCATYHHLKCFTLLLLHGASPDLSCYKHLQIPDYISTQFSVAHAIIKYKCPPEFMFLYREFGGNLWVKDSKGQLASEVSEDAPALNFLKQFQEVPVGLQSLCRLAVRRAVGGGSCESRLSALGLHQKITDILSFRYVDPSQFDPDTKIQVDIYQNLTAVFNEVVEDMTTNYQEHPLAMMWQGLLKEKIRKYLTGGYHCHLDIPEKKIDRNQDTRHPEQVAGPPPPPPPMAPTPPKPKILRFPGAEGLKKKHFSGYKQ